MKVLGTEIAHGRLALLLREDEPVQHRTVLASADLQDTRGGGGGTRTQSVVLKWGRVGPARRVR